MSKRIPGGTTQADPEHLSAPGVAISLPVAPAGRRPKGFRIQADKDKPPAITEQDIANAATTITGFLVCSGCGDLHFTEKGLYRHAILTHGEPQAAADLRDSEKEMLLAAQAERRRLGPVKDTTGL